MVTEASERDPRRTRAKRGVVSIVRTAEELRRYCQRVLAPHGITPSQFHVLRILSESGGKLATLTLAARLIERTPGITRMLDRMESKGLVRRERSPEDRRRILCGLTAKGTRLLDRLLEPLEEAEARFFEALEEGKQEELIRLLDAVCDSHAGPSSP
jgi:DNA-binding MarR family transcriptional regulator